MGGAMMYRIVELRNGKYYSLFHGTNGSRELPVGVWLDADVKQVRNPGSSKYFFESGWHFTTTRKEAADYLTSFSSERSANYVVVEIEVEDVRRKPRSYKNVWLARRMKIIG